ncbi:MAG TPA: hypothetical protein VF678_02130, partial [bacterium]
MTFYSLRRMACLAILLASFATVALAQGANPNQQPQKQPEAQLGGAQGVKQVAEVCTHAKESVPTALLYV